MTAPDEFYEPKQPQPPNLKLKAAERKTETLLRGRFEYWYMGKVKDPNKLKMVAGTTYALPETEMLWGAFRSGYQFGLTDK